MKINKICRLCGKNFLDYPDRNKFFCSRGCYIIGAKTCVSKGKNHHLWKEKIKITCKGCGKEFLIYPCKKGLTKFCSFDCYNKYPKSKETRRKLRDNSLGEKNPFFGEKHSEKTIKFLKENWDKFHNKKSTIKNLSLTNTKEAKQKRINTILEGYKSGRIKSWNEGLTKETDDRLKKLSEKMKIINPMGDPKNAKKVSIAMKGRLNPTFKKLRNTDEFMKKIMEALKIKPNKPEKIIINLIQQNNLNFVFVGNGKKIIGGFNPDFINEEKKLIIEHFGDYWHNLPKTKKRDKKRFEIYNQYNYKTLVIWQKELKNPNKVLDKIKSFDK